MVRNTFGTACLSLLLSMAVGGCAETPPPLSPAAIPPGEGALFGRIKVENKNEDVTGKCTFELTDASGQRKAATKLADDGWVFLAVRSGVTYISRVDCYLGYPASYTTRALHFEVPGGDKIVYFGHVAFDLKSEGPAVSADTAVAVGGLVGAALLLPTGEGKDAQYRSENHFDEAVRQYNGRYGELASRLKPEMSIVDEHSPPTAMGFAFDTSEAVAEARCKRASLTWQKLGEGKFSCSGAPIDLGVPVSVELLACSGFICDVTANAGGDGATWSELFQRFNKLTQLLVLRYGDPQQRSTTALDGCLGVPNDCLAQGRARTSLTWRWSDKHTVSLVLDGGPVTGPTSLSVVFGNGKLSYAAP